jgi:hypothetical protein
MTAGHEEDCECESAAFAVFIVREDVPPEKGQEMGVQAIKQGVIDFGC